MYCDSSAPVPQNVNNTDPSVSLAQSNLRKARVFAEVAFAASRYACAGTVPPEAFPGFGLNFLNQVSRAAALVNKLNAPIVQNLPSTAVQAAVSSRGTSGTPQVVPLNPVDVNPQPPTNAPTQGPFDTPPWGDYQGVWPGICTPGSALLSWLQQNPWLALGGLAAVALASGAIGAGVKRRRRRAR